MTVVLAQLWVIGSGLGFFTWAMVHARRGEYWPGAFIILAALLVNIYPVYYIYANYGSTS